MASLARAAASAAKPLAGRSLGSSLPVPTPARAARILRRSAVARLETLLPLHTPVASARLKSCIAVDSTCWSSLSQEHQDFTWRTSLAARMTQIDIVNALRKGDRQRPSVMLSNLQQTKEALTSEDFSDILEYCAEAPDPLALNWLNSLGGKESTHSPLPIFNIFLSACASIRNLNDAEGCLEKMGIHLVGKSEITYCELRKANNATRAESREKASNQGVVSCFSEHPSEHISNKVEQERG
ncbi:uncharacterized protein LOC100824813 isoform X1 [Brachypodium distachyon]|uniref:uncharacterized protein LOC100824813 isoform X1 n=1 Tax=Brachypodium distachyon TaxID=15368 RepID=UPI000D0D2EB4|nr:uncharacterized protein LOC100824813 isoform X1 [Brachypodium distachyon]|eukprot:XP_024316871.1 uncharacterized protein LOC100824813 isoform X1 [Brachypodium distachyon]